MLYSLIEGDTEIPCCVSKEKSKPQHSQRAPSPHLLACIPVPPHWCLQLSPTGKDSLLQISAFPTWGKESRACHSRCFAAGGRAGLFSCPSPIYLLFLPLQPLSKSSGCYSGMGWTKLLRTITSSNLFWLYSAITLIQWAEWETSDLPGKLEGWLPAWGQKVSQI